MDKERLVEFENRLLKMKRHTGKWARRQGIGCYRIYDAEVPGFPFAIDWYEGKVYMAKYAGKQDAREGPESESWLDACIDIVMKILELSGEEVFVRERRRQKGLQQYERLSQTDHRFAVQENGLSFWVNLSDYLDTGLFLDHRQTRQMVRERSAGKRVLNLFAYTGSFTVYAAAGGASATTTVDLSHTYLNWAANNLQINGFDSGYDTPHRLVQADVKQFLDEHREAYDLIVLDPPTFSNSKRMKDILDIQRDHPLLLDRCLRLSAPGGLIFFSTNYRGFRPQFEGLPARNIREISSATVPPDFRNKQIHRCFLIER